jgi:hypothetical protein
MPYSCAEFTTHRFHLLRHIAPMANYFELATPLPCDVPALYYTFDLIYFNMF